jgi:hypothetical protein
MHKKLSKQLLLFLCLLGLLVIPQNSLRAAPPIQKMVSVQGTQKIVSPQGLIPGQGGGFTRPPQVVLSLDQATQSLKASGNGGGKFMLVDSNGDGRADSIVPAPQGGAGAISLDQAVSTLKGIGGTSKSYVAVDSNGDGKTDSIIAVTY